jgi:hypothetical protein
VESKAVTQIRATNAQSWSHIVIVGHRWIANKNIEIAFGHEHYIQSDRLVNHEFDPSLPMREEILIEVGIQCLCKIFPDLAEEKFRRMDGSTRYVRRIRAEFRGAIIPSYPDVHREIERRHAKRVVETAIKKSLSTLSAIEVQESLNRAVVCYTMEQ